MHCTCGPNQAVENNRSRHTQVWSHVAGVSRIEGGPIYCSRRGYIKLIDNYHSFLLRDDMPKSDALSALLYRQAALSGQERMITVPAIRHMSRVSHPCCACFNSTHQEGQTPFIATDQSTSNHLTIRQTHSLRQTRVLQSN
jgi:hypothetical protein